jgi:copper(I)-binding protein
VKAQQAVARRIGLGLVAVCATLLTSACAAGQHAASAEQTPAIDGTGGQVGTVQLHAVAIKAPAGPSYGIGTDAELAVVLVNTGSTADALTGVTSTAFQSSGVFADAADAGQQEATDAGAGRSAGTSSSAPSAPVASSPAASTPESTTSAGSPAAPTPLTEVPLGAGTSTALGIDATQPVLVLRQLTSAGAGGAEGLFPGESINVTFTFAKAGAVTLVVPVQLRDTVNTAVVPAPPSRPSAA